MSFPFKNVQEENLIGNSLAVSKRLETAAEVHLYCKEGEVEGNQGQCYGNSEI
jgi:hypothetical protein